MKRSKYKPVYIRFYDHSSGHYSVTKPIICDVWGTLYRKTNKCLYIAPWVSGGSIEQDEENSDCYCIVRAAIIKYKELKEK